MRHLMFLNISAFVLIQSSCKMAGQKPNMQPGSDTTVNLEKQTDESRNDEPLIFLRNFYVSYMHAVNEIPKEEKRIMDSLVGANCTENMQKRLQDPDLDYDPFIKGQYVMEEWAKSLNVKKGKADREYVVSFKKEKPTATKTTDIHLILTKENGNYKIDTVLE